LKNIIRPHIDASPLHPGLMGMTVRAKVAVFDVTVRQRHQ
jgi:hypothetical protein